MRLNKLWQKCHTFKKFCVNNPYKINELLQAISCFYHCMKSVRIRSFLWSVFYRSRTEYGDWQCESLNSVEMRENTDHKNSAYAVFYTVSLPKIFLISITKHKLQNILQALYVDRLLGLVLLKIFVMFKIYLFPPHWLFGICKLCWIRRLFSVLPFPCTCIYLAIGGVHIWSSISIFLRQVFRLMFMINISLETVFQRCIQNPVKRLRWNLLWK